MILVTKTCVCVVIPFILDVSFVDVPAGATQEEGHTQAGFFHSFPSSTVKSNFVFPRFNRSLLVGRFTTPRFELTS